MASLADIRPKIAAAIKAAITDAQCDGYVLVSPTGGKFFDVELDPVDGIDPHQSLGNGLTLWTLMIRGCVSSLDLAAQMALDEWTDRTGTKSVQKALEADQTLGGVANAVKVVKVAGYRGIQVPNNQTTYLGAEWTVEVYTQG